MSSIKGRFYILAFCVTTISLLVSYLASPLYSLIIVLPASLVIAGYFSRGVVREIRSLTSVFSGLALHTEKTKIEPLSIEEIGVLGSAANMLIDTLHADIKAPENEILRLKQLMNLVGEGIIIASKNLTIKEINARAKKMFAIEGFDPVGEHLIKVVRDQRVESIIKELVANYQEEGSAGKTVRIFFPTIKNLSLRVEPVDSKDIAILINDVTQSTKLDNLRRDFVSNASHELKTPVAGIKLIAETIESVLDDKELVSKLLKKLDKEATNLARLVTDLLNLSKLEELSTRFEDISVSQLVQSCVDDISSKAEQEQITLNIDLPDDDIVISGDHAQLEMMMTNLLENAIAYSLGKGTVEVSARVMDKGVQIAVKDNGIGIPTKHLDRIFERFYRVDKTRSRNTGGTGLGLSIVKHVVENHGGKVQVRSVLGEGSTFTVWLPA